MIVYIRLKQIRPTLVLIFAFLFFAVGVSASARDSQGVSNEPPSENPVPLPIGSNDPPSENPDPSPNASSGQNEPPQSGSPISTDEFGQLPDIEAKTFPVKLAKKSGSGRIYLFDDLEGRKSKPGNILLIKKEGEAVFALRVLRNYPEKKQMAARRVKVYDPKVLSVLGEGDPLVAIEKISDVIPKLTREDRRDLKEVENQNPPPVEIPDAQNPSPDQTPLGPKVPAYDPELDAGSIPLAPDNEQPEPISDDEEGPESQEGITIEEPLAMDHYRHWASGGFGMILNNASSASGKVLQSFAAGSFRYGYSIFDRPFLDKSKLQDSVVIEAGVSFYKVVNYQTATAGDSFTLLVPQAFLRYNLYFSETFLVFVQGGVLRHYVTSTNSTDPDSLNKLNSEKYDASAGFMFQVGPGWFTRVDLGLQIAALNLVLRF